MNYGISYKGSKNKLAERLINLFPKADNFYDLFCGGCAVAHAALLSHKYKTVHINDIEPKVVDLFIRATRGEFKNETRWISHKEFDRLKSSDYLVACLFSFGNDFQWYLYSKDIEPMKKAAHYAILFGDFSYFREWNKEISDEVESALKSISLSERQKRRLTLCRIVKKYTCKSKIQIQNLERLERLQNLERLERLQNLENLESYINSSSQDYSEIKIKPNSVIYCDIPYEATKTYFKQKFDYSRFYDWCCKQTEPLFISSYNISDPRFKCVSEFEHRSTLNDKLSNKVIERVYMPLTEATERFISNQKHKTVFTADDMFSWE